MTRNTNLLFVGLLAIGIPFVSLGKGLPKGYITCPASKNLHKNGKTMAWVTNGGWKSYETSFANRIDKFLGAQWQGVNVGKITCLYKPNQSLTFAVALHYNHLVYTPKGGAWEKNLGGYMNCKSDKPKNCLFKPQQKIKAQNIYEEAAKLKSQPQAPTGF